MALFDATDLGKLAPHQVEGFDHPIPAVCYRGDALRSGFPIGGIGTGYFELRGDGTVGLSSIYNSYVPQMSLAGPLLTIETRDGKVIPLDARHAEIFVLAHFPVCNMIFRVKEGGPVVSMRLFSPILPGDAEASNTPGVVFEIQAESPFDGVLRINFAMGHNVEPVVSEQQPRDDDLRRREFVRRDDRHVRGPRRRRGMGATFNLCDPRASGDAVRPALPHPPRHRRPGVGERLLLQPRRLGPADGAAAGRVERVRARGRVDRHNLWPGVSPEHPR